jgi:hypothetical protein
MILRKKLEPQRLLRNSQRETKALPSAFSANSSGSSAPKLNVPRHIREAIIFFVVAAGALVFAGGQTRRRPRPSAGAPPRSSGAKYSAFLHSSAKHKSLACNDCHKIPTPWSAQRDFPDVADFPDHAACVRCHRQQFFTRQAMTGTGPAVCTICHQRAAPREDARFAFGKPNRANQAVKPRDERQFTIEFPHDKHQNAIALLQRHHRAKLVDDQKPDYNNCAICHQRNDELLSTSLAAPADASTPANKFFKTVPRSHDACFDCHWKNQKPESRECLGCHKPANTFVASAALKRISAKFNHEGGKGEHLLECTSCHINITRAATLRGLTPDVPVAACASCHKDNKKTTYPKAVTIEEEMAQFRKTNACTYCHAPDVGTKKPPVSHEAAAQ